MTENPLNQELYQAVINKLLEGASGKAKSLLHRCADSNSNNLLLNGSSSELQINCDSEEMAVDLWEQVEGFVSLANDLAIQRIRIKVGEVTAYHFPCRLIVQCSRSPSTMIQITRAKRHVALMQSIPAVAVSLHDLNNEGFTYLEVFASIPERLNKKREEMVGNPVSDLPPVLSEPRIHYLKKALQNGQCEHYSYVYEDTHIWKFDVTIAPLFGTDEAIAIVKDAESWQLGHWVNRIKQ